MWHCLVLIYHELFNILSSITRMESPDNLVQLHQIKDKRIPENSKQLQGGLKNLSSLLVQNCPVKIETTVEQVL